MTDNEIVKIVKAELDALIKGERGHEQALIADHIEEMIDHVWSEKTAELLREEYEYMNDNYSEPRRVTIGSFLRNCQIQNEADLIRERGGEPGM